MKGWGVLVSEAGMWGLPALLLVAYGVDGFVSGQPAGGGIQLGVATLFAWLAYRRMRRLLRQPFWAARQELVEVLGKLPVKVPCLVRDEHVVLYRNRKKAIGIPATLVMRLDEDDAAEFDQHGEALMMHTTFVVTPMHVRVIQITGGNKVATSPDGEPVLVDEPRLPWWPRMRRKVKRFRSVGRPESYAECAELRELVAQIRVAEPVSPDAP